VVDEFNEFKRERFSAFGETKQVRFRRVSLLNRAFHKDETSGTRKAPEDLNLSRSVSICHSRVAKEPNAMALTRGRSPIAPADGCSAC
jgi:hypothetical protein